MTDKVQKIREEVERLQKELIQEKEKGFGSDIDDACILELQNVLAYIDSLKEEPKFKTGDRIKPVDSCLGAPRTILEVCDGWYVTNQGTLDFEFEDNWEAVEEPVSDDLEKAARSYTNNIDNIGGSVGEQTRNAFKAGAEWQKAKDESTTEDLGEYINKLSKQFPEVSFAKLSRIGVRVAKWQKEQMMKDAIRGKVIARFPLASDPLYDDVEIYLNFTRGLSEGDKVRVIIINDD